MANPRKKTKAKPLRAYKSHTALVAESGNILVYIVPVLIITFLVFLPALKNGFTNWDDTLYVTQNMLLENINADGIKAIFTTPVVSNYHPLTILSLAINYQLASLEPWTYHLTSILLHVSNTFLVFVFVMFLSSKNIRVSAAVALLFGIHPMHVESVAWISERKDLMYAFFYLLALIVYVRYLEKKQIKYLLIVTTLGALSLLSKPAAIVLPLSLLLLDYYFKRTWSPTWLLEKIPLFIFSAIIAYVTVDIQSVRAIAGLAQYDILERICFAGFGLIWYLIKVLVPVPLSALHPFPTELTAVYYITTLLALAGVALLVFKIKNRLYHFGFGFYIINLLLVLQLVSIGNAVVAERYTYLPYIGLFFLLCMEVNKLISGKWHKYRSLVYVFSSVWLIALSAITVLRIPVWKNSESLWNNVLEQYPESPRAWTNRGLMYYDSQEWSRVVEDLSMALKHDSMYPNALEWRARAYLELNDGDKALTDAKKFYSIAPEQINALFILARSYAATGNAEEAVRVYNELIIKSPNIPEYINNRGVIYFNSLKLYKDARKDFETCIQLRPNTGLYYINLSRCYYMMGDSQLAKANAQRARELGETIDPAYAGAIGLQ